MEKNVKQIRLLSDPDTPYFLQVAWEKGLGFGFSVTLCNGQLAWTGTVSKEEVSKDAADMEMERGKYLTELQNALCLRAEMAGIYTYDFAKEDDEDDCFCFSYEKSLRDVVFRLGSLTLRKVSSPSGVITDLISYCLSNSAGLRARNEHLRRENERLLTDWNHMHEQLEAFVNLKEELEKDLYTRFILVLNEKKSKIRSLLEKLVEAESLFESQAEEENPTTKENGCECSTEEELSSQTSENTEETATLSRRYSLRSSIDNVPEVEVPTRRRRERVQKSNVKEHTEVDKEAAPQEKKNPEPVSQKKTGQRTSNRKASLKATKETEDPDDLFKEM